MKNKVFKKKENCKKVTNKKRQKDKIRVSSASNRWQRVFTIVTSSSCCRVAGVLFHVFPNLSNVTASMILFTKSSDETIELQCCTDQSIDKESMSESFECGLEQNFLHFFKHGCGHKLFLSRL